MSQGSQFTGWTVGAVPAVQAKSEFEPTVSAAKVKQSTGLSLTAQGLPLPKPPTFQPGDWECPNPSCKMINFKRRSSCMGCGVRPGAGDKKRVTKQQFNRTGRTNEPISPDTDEDELWMCDFCGHDSNKSNKTHCVRCTTPSLEFLEQVKEEQRRERERSRSRSSERDRREEMARRRRAFEENSALCLPQKHGNQSKTSRRVLEGVEDRQPEKRRPIVSERQDLETDRVQWNSDDEEYDDYGRLKKKKGAATQAEPTASAPAKAAGTKTKGKELSAKQQAALARLQSKAQKSTSSA